MKKKADIALSRNDLDWLILRPSLLVDIPGKGFVSLGPAEFHDQIAYADVAETLAELLHEPRIRQQILDNSIPGPHRSERPSRLTSVGLRWKSM
ncbi:NAD(P)H-binding protein [Paenibacillus sp. ClWae2A]|uniref:NAD(P)H-binding protein n=1 Tax=Paenibacillus sp. ClWae2A TaxID=3057177 RepID=UPI0037CC5C7B